MKVSIKRLLVFSLAYLALPHYIFILGWIHPAISIISTIVLLLLSWKIFLSTKNDAEISDTLWLSKKQAMYWIGLTLALTAFAGIGEWFWQRDDFFKHNLIFSDLQRNYWPVTYTANGNTSMLTYYLGWYMVPALVGKLAGGWAIAFTSFLYTCLGLGLFFLWLSAALKTTKITWWLLFICLSGFEFLWIAGHLVYYIVSYYPQYGIVNLITGTLAYTRSELITPQLNQNIPSFFVGFLSAPQHVVPGFLASAMVVFLITKKLPSMYSFIVLSLTLFWSPLVTIGIAPFVLLHAFKQIMALFSKQNIWSYLFCLTILFFTISYMLAHFPINNKGFVWQYANTRHWLFYTLVFIALKFGIIFTYLWYKNKKLNFIGEYALLVYISFIGLLLLSFYKLGAYNDLIARASIPFYFVLLLVTILFLQKIALEKIKRYMFVWLIIALMVIPRFWQVYKTLANTQQKATKKYEIANVPHNYTILNHNQWLLEVKPEHKNNYVIDDAISEQYLGSTHSFFYTYLAKKPLQ